VEETDLSDCRGVVLIIVSDSVDKCIQCNFMQYLHCESATRGEVRLVIRNTAVKVSIMSCFVSLCSTGTLCRDCRLSFR